MKKMQQKLIIVIVIINFIGIMLKGAIPTDNSKTTIINDASKEDTLDIIKDKGEIHVVTPLNDIAYFYLDTKTDEIKGIDADILFEIGKRIGINKVEMEVAPFSDLLERLNSDNNIDISAGGIYITPEREEIVSFTQPLYKGSEAIVVPTFSTINFISDLKDAVIGVAKGTVFEKLAEKWKENNLIKDVVTFETSVDVLNAVNSYKTDIDAGIVDSVIVKYSLSEDKNLLLRMLKDYTPEITGNVGIAVRKNDTALLNTLNGKIDKMKADGTLYAILVENGLDKSNMV